jgi:hypothetical protein
MACNLNVPLVQADQSGGSAFQASRFKTDTSVIDLETDPLPILTDPTSTI